MEAAPTATAPVLGPWAFGAARAWWIPEAPTAFAAAEITATAAEASAAETAAAAGEAAPVYRQVRILQGSAPV